MKALKHWFFALLFPFFPKRLLSRLTGVFMRLPLPAPLAAIVVPGFARFFNITLHEAEFSAGRYRSLDDFFTRRLQPHLRPVDGHFVHPVDGQLTQNTTVEGGQLVQVKGWTYGLGEFLGDDALAAAYEGGHYYTWYLCPADYHRVHAPTAGELFEAKHIPGLLWPVNEWSVNNVKRLFCLNERVVMNFTGEAGRWSLVLVGATNVGHITLTHDPALTTKQWFWREPKLHRYDPPHLIGPGDELGMFHLGSTVVCVFEKSFGRGAAEGRMVRMGEAFV